MRVCLVVKHWLWDILYINEYMCACVFSYLFNRLEKREKRRINYLTHFCGWMAEQRQRVDSKGSKDSKSSRRKEFVESRDPI